jgi:hypothetical protein
MSRTLGRLRRPQGLILERLRALPSGGSPRHNTEMR